MANRGTIYTTPGVTQQRFESLLAKNYIGIGQIVGEELSNENVKDKKQTYSQDGTSILLFRYKVRLCTKIDDTVPNDQVIFAFGQNNGPSGKGGFLFGNWRYPDGEFVEVYQHPVTGLYYIDNSVPVGVGVTLTQNRNGTQGCQPLSGYKPGSPTFQVSLANQGPNGGAPVGEITPPHTPDATKWDKLYENMPTIELKTPCEPSSIAGVGGQISNLLREIQDLRTGLLGDDSFLVTSAEFVSEAQSKVDGVASMMTGVMTWLIQEIKKQVMRLINSAVNNTVGSLYLNTRYQLFEGVNSGLAAVSCAFAAILDALAQFISNALNNFINDIISPAVCAIENFLADLLTQIVNGILNAISGILAGIGNIIGAAIEVVDTILGVVESLLNIFEGCPPQQVCPSDKEWNFLDGVAGSGGSPIDIQGIFDRVNSAFSAVSGLGDAVTSFPSNFDGFDFGLDPTSALASAGGCFVGPTPCGPPLVSFFGGGAVVSATGTPVISPSGGVIGITITSSGFGYTSPPMIVVSDPCGLGVGAIAVAGLGSVTVPPRTPSGGFSPKYTLKRGRGLSTSPPGPGGGPSGPPAGPPAGPAAGPFGPPAGPPAVPFGPPAGPGVSPFGPGVGPFGPPAGPPAGPGVSPFGPPAGPPAGPALIVPTAPTVNVGSGTSIACLFPSNVGYNGPGVYLNLFYVNGTVDVNFLLTVNGSIDYELTIPGVKTFSVGGGSGSGSGVSTLLETITLEGGYLYGPCTAVGGNVYPGNIIEDSISNSGTLPDTSAVVAPDGALSWNAFTLSTNRGNFLDLVDCTSEDTPSVGVTTAIILATGFGYLPAPDGTRGANGRVYTDRCQTLVQRALGTWDQPYNPGDIVTLETGDRISLPGQNEIEIGDATLPRELSKIGAYIVRVNPPLATVSYRSMVGFDDTIGPPSSATLRSMVGFDYTAYGESGFGLLDLEAARKQGYSDAEIRNYLENDYPSGSPIGPRMRDLLNDPNWGRVAATPGSSNRSNWFSMEDYEEARRQGFTDADIRFYLEKNYVGKISPRVQSFLNDPNWGRLRTSSPGYYGIRQMFDFDDSSGSAANNRNHFGYITDYVEARRRGYSDADIRYYLENHYTGKIGPRMEEALKDPNFGRIQGITNMGGVPFGTPKNMRGFSDAYGDSGAFGNLDYEEARRQGFTDADIRYYLENHYTGIIGARIQTRLNDPAWGKVQVDRGFSDVPGDPGAFGLLDYEQATRQNQTDYEFLSGSEYEYDRDLYRQAVQEGYTDADVRYFLENYYTGQIGPAMQARLDDPNWGRELPTLTSPITSPPPRVRSMVGFNDSSGRKDEFDTSDLQEARRQGFRDVDVRFYLENNYNGFIAEGMRRLLSDPNWGRLGQTITVSLTAPGCPDDVIIEDFISTSDILVASLDGAVISDPGFRYDCANDTIEVVPSNGAELEYECVNGSISAVRVVNPGSGFTELPEIRINTNTGYNAKIVPVLGFKPISTESIGAGVTSIRVVDCVGTIPPRRQFDIVPE